MSQKTITIEGIGDVTVGRRKGTRSLRLSIRSDGRLRVGAPSWVTEKAIGAFVRSQQDWIDANMPDSQARLRGIGAKYTRINPRCRRRSQSHAPRRLSVP